MIDDFITSYKIKNTYRVNSIIYTLKNLPLIGKAIPSSLYGMGSIKIFANVLSAIYEVLSLFVGKFFYVLLLIGLTSQLYGANQPVAFIHIFTLLTIIGAFNNSSILEFTKDKYYAIVLMKFDAKKYVVPNYLYFIIRTVVGFIPAILIMGLKSKVSLATCLIMPLFVIFSKFIVTSLVLFMHEKTGKVRHEKFNAISLIISLVLFVAAYALPAIHIAITQNIFYILFGIVAVLGIFSFIYIITFKKYKSLFKGILSASTMSYLTTAGSKDEQLKYTNNIIENANAVSNKKGYEYFNDIFVKRHRKILMKSTKNISIITICVFIAIGILIFLADQKLVTKINEFTQMCMPYFLFIMYMINRGTSIANVMFMNCDHSMLSYRFYRQPKAILKLFRERLKTMITINMIPAIIIGAGLCLVLFATGGTTNYWTYPIIFFTILAMSIFFSVHYLVLYYLLQPYTLELEMKSPLYSAIISITYFVAYMAIQVEIPTLIFGICVILFSIIYCFIALALVYKFANKTFKLRT